jgi:hypothetical protein
LFDYKGLYWGKLAPYIGGFEIDEDMVPLKLQTFLMLGIPPQISGHTLMATKSRCEDIHFKMVSINRCCNCATSSPIALE